MRKLTLALIFLIGIFLTGCPHSPKVATVAPVPTVTSASVAYGQVSVGISPVPKLQFLDVNGKPLAGGLVYTCVSGLACPGNPLASYTDYTGNTQNSNPVVLDSGGFASIWLSANLYTITVQDVNAVQQYSIDGINQAAFANLVVGGTITAPNINNVRYANAFAGADAGAKINACLADLPAAGGTCDARGLQGTQSAAAVITVGSHQRLLLGAITLTTSNNPGISITLGSSGASGSLLGIGSASVINYTGIYSALQASGFPNSSMAYVGFIKILGTSSGVAGIRLVTLNNFTIDSVNVNGFTSGDGFRSEGADEVTVYNSVFQGNKYGVHELMTFAGGVTNESNDNHFIGGGIVGNSTWGVYEDVACASGVCTGSNLANSYEGINIAQNGVDGASLTSGNMFIQNCIGCLIQNNTFENPTGTNPLQQIVLGDAGHGVVYVEKTIVRGNLFASQGNHTVTTIQDINSEYTTIDDNTEGGLPLAMYANGVNSQFLYFGCGNRIIDNSPIFLSTTSYYDAANGSNFTCVPRQLTALNYASVPIVNMFGASATGIAMNYATGAGHNFEILGRANSFGDANIFSWGDSAAGATKGVVTQAGLLEAYGGLQATQTATRKLTFGTTPVISLTQGTETTNGGTGKSYVAEVWIDSNATLTGIQILNGSTIGTNKGQVALYDGTGTLVGNSSTGGTTTSGAHTFQSYAFTATHAVVGPALYYVVYIVNGSADTFQCTATPIGATALLSGTFGTFPATITPPTAWTAQQGPIALVY